ncbi:Putative outer membrane protein [Helicobacter mustelae 12198]|uniref:Putative outer membrane protein n=2 Tax=Helicobacter mustelae TaxID=217 RepID=D3UFL3_HELM1|nr:Putative outer membrane protein [Helicobacter mustelae 12198]
MTQGMIQSSGSISYKGTFQGVTQELHGSAFYKMDSSKNFGPLVSVNLGTEHLFFQDIFGFRWSIGVGYQSLAIKDRILPTFPDPQLNAYNTAIKTLEGPRFDASFDLMLNFFRNEKFSFGMFGGIQYNLYLAKFATKDSDFSKASIKITNDAFSLDLKTQGFNGQNTFGNAAYRVGLSMMFAKHHRVEFYISRNIASNSYKRNNERKNIYRQGNLEEKQVFKISEMLKLGTNTYMLSYKYVF